MRLAEKLGCYLRYISKRLPDIGTKVIVHLHRPFIGNTYVPIHFESFQIFVNPQDYCGGRLYYWGSYEVEQTKFLADLVHKMRPGTFIDVGANIGFYSLLIAAKGIPVIAVEASPQVLPALERSISSNHALSSRIRLVRAAADSSEGEVTFWANIADHNFGLGSMISSHPESQPTPFRVPSVKIDDVVGPETPQPLLFKVDVEGAEMRVLKGMPKTIRSFHPVFVIEVHPLELKAAGSMSMEVLTLLWNYGYRTHELGDNGEEITAVNPLPDDNFWIVAT